MDWEASRDLHFLRTCIDKLGDDVFRSICIFQSGSFFHIRSRVWIGNFVSLSVSLFLSFFWDWTRLKGSSRSAECASRCGVSAEDWFTSYSPSLLKSTRIGFKAYLTWMDFTSLASLYTACFLPCGRLSTIKTPPPRRPSLAFLPSVPSPACTLPQHMSLNT